MDSEPAVDDGNIVRLGATPAQFNPSRKPLYTEDDWESRQPRLKDLWLVKNLSLSKTMVEMSKEGFDAECVLHFAFCLRIQTTPRLTEATASTPTNAISSSGIGPNTTLGRSPRPHRGYPSPRRGNPRPLREIPGVRRPYPEPCQRRLRLWRAGQRRRQAEPRSRSSDRRARREGP